MRRLILAAPLLFSFSIPTTLSACGGNGAGDGGNGADGGGGIDAPSNPGNECRAGAMSSTDVYQPMQVGDVWTYNVTEIGTGNTYVKRTEITEQMTPPGEPEPVLVQVTTKSTGKTVSWFRRVGEAVIRLRQEDYDPQGLLERTTVYEPYRLRLDENPAMITAGASFDETYTDVVYDPQGVELQRTDVIDHWLIVSEDEPCTPGWGAQLSCIHAHRERVLGGVAIKDFYFARGYGKVREEGGQSEILGDCALH